MIAAPGQKGINLKMRKLWGPEVAYSIKYDIL